MRSFLVYFLLLGGAWTAACMAQTPDSLYDSTHARKLGPAMQGLLGPKSGETRYDPRMIRAAQIALKRARQKTTWHCWRAVKDALLASETIASRPTSPWARQAGEELCEKFGFVKLKLTDPYRAPVGAVVVYGGADAGHVELRTASGFVSDFVSATPYPRPLIGIYVKSIPG